MARRKARRRKKKKGADRVSARRSRRLLREAQAAAALAPARVEEVAEVGDGRGVSPLRDHPRRVTTRMRELAFVRAFVAGPEGVRGNQTESARAAGYRGSDQVLSITGVRLRRRPHVAAEIEKELESIGATYERALQELGRVAFYDQRDLDAVRRAVLSGDVDEVDDRVAAVVASFEVHDGENGRTVRVRGHDKVQALRTIMQVRGKLTSRHEHSGPGGGPIPVAAQVAFYELPASRRVVVRGAEASRAALPAPADGDGA